MALILGALLIQGIQPGPQLITEHADLFWGLIASFWVGNVLLVMLNVPLIGDLGEGAAGAVPLHVSVRRCSSSRSGVYSTNNSLFEVGEVLVFGVVGAVFVALEFPVAPILLGYVLGPMVEENFRRALLLSRGDLAVFVQRPISACFIAACALLVVLQAFFALRAARRKRHGLKENVLPEVPTMDDAQRDTRREPPLAHVDHR